MGLRGVWAVVWEAGDAWLDDRAPRIAAALAFFTALSMAPLLVIALLIAGAVYGAEAARGEIAERLTGLVGEQAAAAVEVIVANARGPGTGAVAVVVSLITLFIGATGVFVELQEALNDVWKVRPKPGRPLRTFARARLTSLVMGIGIGVLMLASLVLTTVIEAVGQYAASTVAGTATVVQVVNLVALFGVEALLFAMIFKFLPNARLGWRDVGMGALLTAVLFTIGKFLVGTYLRYTGSLSGFGAAGSLMAFLVWIYFSAMVLVFGAEVTKVTARRAGRAVVPTDNAEVIRV
ncbi:YihY/virulence factor BrkB family protein [Gemmata sp. G18]|uniref:YihY/virulence factor BrkB family protein n=1 Tax=Gemmata palustris TaxID=2822762 RepID=A0ABS5C302_9BACT|nr:YihY/virulence factor BrkB family protein [Gemmata palustris]MBP3959855.1 YihY/virulence factor BrkB family protein [Gemmata palustris]